MAGLLCFENLAAHAATVFCGALSPPRAGSQPFHPILSPPFSDSRDDARILAVASHYWYEHNGLPPGPIELEIEQPPLRMQSLRPRTVTWLINGDETYGVRSAVLTLAEGLPQLGWRANMLAFHEGLFTNECRERGLEVRCVDVGPAPTLFGGVVGKASGLIRLARFRRGVVRKCLAELRDHRPDIIHFLWPQFAAIAGPLAERLGSGCVWEMPNALGRTLWGLNRRAYQWTCRRYHILPLANSAWTAATLRGGGVEPRVFHLGADARRFDPQTVEPVSREKLGVPPDVPLFGIFARIDGSKGQERVIRAMPALRNSPAFHLLLVGGGSDSEMARLRAAVSECKLRERVHFAGAVQDVERYYAAVDVVINSRVDAEPFGLSIIEAMLMGKPVLAHRLGGPSEIIVDGATGWLLPEAGVDALAAGLDRALSDRSRWVELGREGRARALNCFTRERQIERYSAAIEPYLPLAQRDRQS